MFTLTQVQYIFDYGMCAFYQCAEKTRPDAVKRAAQVAAAAAKMVDKEANMGIKTRDAVMTAGIQAVVFNKDLTGEAHREAFDIQFALSMKICLEQLFNVENISEYDKSSNKTPSLPLTPVNVAEEVPLLAEQFIALKTTSNFSPKFFTHETQQDKDKIDELDNGITLDCV